MVQDSNVGTRSVSDPLALRALAHPIRQRLHGLVAREGTLTAADAARVLGISHALASHHLRQLAKYGFVEEAEAADGRARPWRVTSTSYSVDAQQAEARVAHDVLQQQAVRRAADELTAWQQRAGGEEAADLGGVWSGLVYLTPDELRAVLEQWSALILPFVDARPVGQHGARPDGALPVAITLVRAPLDPTEHGG